MTNRAAGKWIRWFDEVGIEDVPLVGGKNASLGEMIRELRKKGVNIPGGFAVTAEAYRYLLDSAGIRDEMKSILSDLDTSDMSNLRIRGRRIRDLIRRADFPEDLRREITAAYRHMCDQYGPATDVAVRSSATAEDAPDASFAGQQQTYLNVVGEDEVLDACSLCFASLFTDRAISYRQDTGYDHLDVSLSIGVQKMVRSDSASAGVMFTLDTESGFRDVVLVSAAYGLGENVVQGTVDPDEYYVFKPTMKAGKRAIIRKHLGSKAQKMIYSHRDEATTRNVSVPRIKRGRYVLTDDEILRLARWACIIEDHYSAKAGRYVPMDIEWAKDGDGKEAGSGELFVVQARPETVHSQRDTDVYETYVLKEKGNVLVSGRAIGQKIGQGVAKYITSAERIAKFNKGEVLVTKMTDPDWEPIMKMAAAIVTDRGGRTCHAAIVSRELGIPCITGTENATDRIKMGQPVTVACCEGLTGHVYDGLLKYDIKKIHVSEVPKTKTKIMLNVGLPEVAFAYAHLPCAGVGLARLEFIISSYIGIHPLALLDYEKISERAEGDPELARIVRKIDEITSAEPDKARFFTDSLARGIGRIAAAFYPKDVIVRLSDFKSNEYSNLIGGHMYEPVESNPMIGWRGASRYYSEKFKPAFELECRALHKAREEFGLTNIKIMIPFCRTPEEGTKVIELMRASGLRQGEDGLEIYMMVEIPSNVMMAAEFAELFDGFSIGSNDLTQLTLGLDRDSELVSHIYSERNEAVKRMIRHVIDVGHQHGVKVGICGQAPSDLPDFAAFLVECGIDSISLNPDTVIKTTLDIRKREDTLEAQPTRQRKTSPDHDDLTHR
jgi:pyruvate,water dikinase